MTEAKEWTRIEGAGSMWTHDDGRVVVGRDGQTIEEILHEIENAAPPPEAEAATVAELTIRVFRTRFESSEDDMDLYDALDERMRAERRSLVRQQWADPDAQITEGGALYNAITTHLDALAPDRKAELLARP